MERDADFVFLNVGNIIELNAIYHAFYALVRIEISQSVNFGRFEIDILDSIFNVQSKNKYDTDFLFLKRIDEALRFIFLHNVAKAAADNNNLTHQHTTNICGANLRILILQAPKRLNALILDTHNNANNNNANAEYTTDLNIGFFIEHEIEQALRMARDNNGLMVRI
jgi:hypothetical protein